MHTTTRFAVGVLGITLMLVLLGCAVHGAKYSEVVTKADAGSGRTRIVLLRPNGRYDDYLLSRAVLKVNDREVGKLAYGGFLFVDIDAQDVSVEASARNPMFGACERRIATLPGETVYLDVAPRAANVAATLVGAVAGAAAVGGGPTRVGLDEILLVDNSVRTAAVSTVGGLAGSAVTSIGRQCGGPFKLTPLSESAALRELEHLSLSE